MCIKMLKLQTGRLERLKIQVEITTEERTRGVYFDSRQAITLPIE